MHLTSSALARLGVVMHDHCLATFDKLTAGKLSGRSNLQLLTLPEHGFGQQPALASQLQLTR